MCQKDTPRNTEAQKPGWVQRWGSTAEAGEEEFSTLRSDGLLTRKTARTAMEVFTNEESIKPFTLCYIKSVSGDWQPARVLAACSTTKQAGNVDLLTEEGYMLKNVSLISIVRRFSNHPPDCRRYWPKATRQHDGARFLAGMWVAQGLVFGFFKDDNGTPFARLVQPREVWEDSTAAALDCQIEALRGA